MAQKHINEHLIFDDISRDLISLKLKNKKVTLGQAAAFCLDCLIAAQGDVVSQETLIEEGWRKHGFEVSSGNVRQVISQLRRAFSRLKESPDLLITVHKLGYRLQVELSQFSTTEDVHIVSDEAELIEVDQTSEVIFADDRVSQPLPKLKVKKNKTPYFIFSAILLVNAIVAIGYFFTTSESSLSQVYYQPFLESSAKGKHIFVDQRLADKPDVVKSSLKLLMSSPFWEKDRVRYHWIYLNAAVEPKLHSFFLCDQPITEKRLQCTSRVFVED